MLRITVDRHDYVLWRRVDRKEWPGDRAIPFHKPGLETVFDNYCRELLTYKWSASDTAKHLDLLVWYKEGIEQEFQVLLSTDIGECADLVKEQE